MTKREWALAIAVAAVCMAASWTLFAPEDGTVSATRGDRRVAAPPPRATGPDAAGSAPAAEAWPAQVFAARAAWPPLAGGNGASAGWAPAPPPPPPAPPPPPPAPPPPPQAPPFPYELIGQLQESDRTVAYLSGASRVAAVAVGDTLDGQWRITALNRNQLQALWLPGQLSVTVNYKPRTTP